MSGYLFTSLTPEMFLTVSQSGIYELQFQKAGIFNTWWVLCK